MAGKLWYEDWFNSPYYHKLYSRQDDPKTAENFVRELIRRLKPSPTSRIIDLGCGTGAITSYISSLGFDTTGIDYSSLNVTEAKDLENEHLHFFLHDLRLPFWINYFDIALNLSNRFGYYHTRREHESAIRTIAKGLKPGGLLVIDFINVHHWEDNPPPNETIQVGSTNYSTLRWEDENYFYRKFTITDGSLNDPIIYTEKLTKFTLGDFTDMLSFQGMQVQQVYGNYDFSEYDIRKTPRMIIFATKDPMKNEDKEKRLYSDGRKTDALT
jgi:SAM-dependent methyltransferase